ncbi:RING-CH-type domain-containing protein [Heracleum sosnowskyi]|uniref:RING-CH-type domain-containing protein n=1 Tax=Heracleum sosnowskyi TaxID=360622 RepID=A0AAD8J9T9_9APIA|nr:RING-CH-type domain-containing protein [Heracleum sosnowskyi]
MEDSHVNYLKKHGDNDVDVNDEDGCINYPSPSSKDGKRSEISDEMARNQPERTLEGSLAEVSVKINISRGTSPTPNRLNLPTTPSSSRINVPSSPSSAQGSCSPPSSQDKSFIARTFSLTNLFTTKMKLAASLPVSPVAHSNPGSTHGGSPIKSRDAFKHGNVHRSKSVPDLIKGTQSDSLGGVFRVIPATPHVAGETGSASISGQPLDADGNDADHDHILEEEAVCRICLVELGEEDGDTFKMECNCKGDLALVHKECVIKWFSIKGNKICEVCKQEVENLPVTLLRIQPGQSNRGRRNRAGSAQNSILQNVPVLVVASMICYFCFLEELLSSKLGSTAITISLPFSCVMGILASIASTTMVPKSFAWLYATIQLALVVVFAHLFFRLLGMRAILAVFLAAFCGFGTTIVGTIILVGLLKLAL